MKNDNTSVDIDFAEAAVPHYARRGIVTMFMIMLGFTFFSASMWVGKELADGLDFGGFIISMIIRRPDPEPVHRSARLRRCKNRSVT